MTITYLKRNLENIAKLADHTKAAAQKWHDYLVANNIDILIYETIRTEAQQRENVKKGASQTMKSYHLKGQALDFVPVAEGGRTDWNGYTQPKIKQAIAEAKRLGFEWGGDWKDFIDRPHLQFNHKGYGTDTFGQYVLQSTLKASIVYEAHCQEIGWQGKRRNGETAGTIGQARRIEALTVKLENSSARLEMEGHIEGLGWTSLRTNGEIIGTIGEGLRMEAIKIKASGLNVLYRVHIQNIGWTDWKRNGEVAGTTGQALRIEAIEIKLA